METPPEISVEAEARPAEFDTTLQFRAYTTKEGYRQLDEVLRMHQTLYNAALQNRRDAWKMRRESISYFAQSKELTAIRQEWPEWSAQHRRLATGTLRRADLAFKAFFQRVQLGQTPGFPRFKPMQRFRTLETHGVEPAMLRRYPEQDRAVIRVKGLPELELRLKGRALPPASKLTALRITREGRRCTVSLGFRVPKKAMPETGHSVGLDMRMAIARAVTSDGKYWEKREPDTARIKRRQRRMSRSRKGSNNRRKKVGRLRNAHRHERVRDHQATHRLTSRMVRLYDRIAVEKLDIQAMTRSARGTAAEPGSLVRLTADMNRRALEQTWGKIRQQLAYKAAWAGRRFAEVDPAFTSRTCSRCGWVVGIPQVSPVFRCGACGVQGHTAHNAAVNILRRSFGPGEGGTKGESPSLHTPLDVASIRELSRMRVEIPLRPPKSLLGK